MYKDLISVVVITYNSEKYIEETLESIREQTYTNIEIIISDDNSKDNTINVCKKWKEKNKKNYVIKILETNSNTGLSKNINRGVKAASGNWIKTIAGDDILDKNCIKKNLEYVKKNNSKIVFSEMIMFQKNKNNLIKKYTYDQSFFKKNAKDQFKELLNENTVYAPTVFFEKKMIEKNNFFEEKYPMIEDYPTWLKLTENGVKLHVLNEVTVFYRRSDESLSYNKNEVINIRMFEFRKQLYNDYLKFKTKNLYFHYREYLKKIRCENVIKKGNKKKTYFYYFIFFLEMSWPLKIIKKILRRSNEKI